MKYILVHDKNISSIMAHVHKDMHRSTLKLVHAHTLRCMHTKNTILQCGKEWKMFTLAKYLKLFIILAGTFIFLKKCMQENRLASCNGLKGDSDWYHQLGSMCPPHFVGGCHYVMNMTTCT